MGTFRKYRKCFKYLMLVSVSLSGTADAAEWFFRPFANGPYGSGEGSSYTNAWHADDQILWGSGGIQPGDTLYICGTHDSGPRDQRIFPRISGTQTNRITISGSCPKSPGTSAPEDFDKGYIFAANRRLEGGWSATGNGTYVRENSACVNTQATEDQSTRLTQIRALESDPDQPATPFKDWPAGSFFQPLSACNGSGLLYYKPSSGSPFSHTVHTGSGEAIVNIRNVSNITVRDLVLEHSNTLDGLVHIENARNIVIDNNTIRWAGGIAISISRNSDNGSIINNRISESANGVYFNVGPDSSNNSDNWLVANNEIFDIDQECYYCHPDSHAIAFQGGSNNIVENNHLHHIGGSGITFYTFPLQEQENNIIRYNYIHDVADFGPCSVKPVTGLRVCRNERGIEHSSSNRDNPDTSGRNIVHHNVIAHIGSVALRSKGLSTPSGPAWRFFNNTVVDAGTALSWLEFSRPDDDITDSAIRNPGVEARNNIFVDSREYHVRQEAWQSSKSRSGIILSNNLYYPQGTESGNRFQWLKNIFSDFSSWADLSGQGQGSITEDPGFVSVSANDFRLTTGSPAVQAGQRVSLTSAALGFSPGPRPDMGALEIAAAALVAPATTSTTTTTTATTTTTQAQAATSTTTVATTSTTTMQRTTTTSVVSSTTTVTSPTPVAVEIPATAVITDTPQQEPPTGPATPVDNDISASSSGALPDSTTSPETSSGGGGGCTVLRQPGNMTFGPWLWLLLGGGYRLVARKRPRRMVPAPRVELGTY